MSTSKPFSWTDRIETVINELATLMEGEAAAGRVGGQVVDKFNHLVNTWNKARPSLASGHRGDYTETPLPSAQECGVLVEVAAPPVHVSMPETVVGVERPQANFVRLSFGFVNLNSISLLDVKSRQVYINGVVKSLDREDTVKLIYWVKSYKAH